MCYNNAVNEGAVAVINLVPHNHKVADARPIVDDAAGSQIPTSQPTNTEPPAAHLLLMPLRLSFFITNFILLGES